MIKVSGLSFTLIIVYAVSKRSGELLAASVMEGQGRSVTYHFSNDELIKVRVHQPTGKRTLSYNEYYFEKGRSMNSTTSDDITVFQNKAVSLVIRAKALMSGKK